MKKILNSLFLGILLSSSAVAQTDCLSVSYKNIKNETGVITFCFENANTLMVNNYQVNNQNHTSTVLFTLQGIEPKENDPILKSNYKPLPSFPDINAKEYQGFPIEFVELQSGQTKAKIWFTKKVKFYNSKNYWLFCGSLGNMIEEKYSGYFPVALQLIENSEIVYEHVLIQKTKLTIKPEVFKSSK